jgi:hypothetical protein
MLEVRQCHAGARRNLSHGQFAIAFSNKYVDGACQNAANGTASALSQRARVVVRFLFHVTSIVA